MMRIRPIYLDRVSVPARVPGGLGARAGRASRVPALAVRAARGCVRSRPRPANVQDVSAVIDRLRDQIQQRLDQALSEADRLRKALIALGPRSVPAPARKAAGRVAQSRRRTAPATPGPKGSPAPRARGRRSTVSAPTSTSKTGGRRTPAAAKPAAASTAATTPEGASSARPQSPRRRTRASAPVADTATTPSRRRRTATARPATTATAPAAPPAPETASGQATGTTKRTRRPRAAASEPAAPVSPTGSAPAGLSAPATSDTAPTSEQPVAPSPRRTPPGQTRGAVLAALAGGGPLTAGQVADRAGLSRATVSTTLSRLAKTGEVQKADRGYRLAPASQPEQPTATTAAPGAAAELTGAPDAASPAAPPSTGAQANSDEPADSTSAEAPAVSAPAPREAE